MVSLDAASPLPSPPFYHIEGLVNFRDIGRYPIASNPRQVIAPGFVFRSAEPSRLTDVGIADLQRFGIAQVYDLRSRTEVDGQPPREWPGATRFFTPVFHEVSADPAALALRLRKHADVASQGSEGFSQLYIDFLTAGSKPDHPVPPFRTILRHLASVEKPSPILVHCTAGKDRTGIICAIILKICGVDDDIVAHEYALTDVGLRERHEELLKYLLSHEEFHNNAEAAWKLISARKESMLATLNKIRELYGSVEAFVKDKCQLSDEDLERIRGHLIIDLPDGEGALDWTAHAKLA